MGLREFAGTTGVEPVEVLPWVSLPEPANDVLPQVPAQSVADACKRLTADELDLAMRHKILSMSWSPTETQHGTSTPAARDEATRRGLVVSWQVGRDDLAAALHRQFGKRLLNRAVNRLSSLRPDLSARRRVTQGQMVTFLLFVMAAVAGAALLPAGYAVNALACAGSLFFLMVISLRIMCLLPSLSVRTPIPPPLPDDALPVYSVLVPVFREIPVLKQLIGSLSMIRYPRDKLDIKIIVEENDMAMVRAVQALRLPAHFDVIMVPAGNPQTKPRALNYALQFARGSLITIYDAEDVPAPMQLRKAAEMFAVSGPELACLQATLAFYNPNESWLTRQFTAEYAALFSVILPALADQRYPLLLGGTSNHFRTALLEKAGGWDPFNVTEDADLGIRLSRMGYSTGILDSITQEEANTQLFNWLNQRRRWLKGFLQTWLVHSRHPFRVIGEVGLGGFCVIQAMTIGIFASALLHPLLLAHGLWQLSPEQLKLGLANPATAIAGAMNLMLLLSGYVTAAAVCIAGLRRSRIAGRWRVIANIPLYWLLISLAAWLALWDFMVKPFYWHKTAHGLSRFARPHDNGTQRAHRQR